MAKAYGSLTILDLLDTATYIYYAEDENGTGVRITPDANSKYIGIYSGKTLPNGQPDPNFNSEEYNNIKEKITWSRYVGPKGDSITIDDDGTFIKYATSTDGQTAPEPTSDDWQDSIPTLNKGEYLWTKTTVKYSDGKKTVSYSVSYSGLDGNDGNDANAYYIETNQKEILRFVSSESGEPTTIYSPAILNFSIYKAPMTESSDKLELINDSGNLPYKLQFLSGKSYSDIVNPVNPDEDTIENPIGLIHYINDNTVCFNVTAFYNSEQAKNLDDEQPHFFRFWYYDENGEEAAIQIIESRLGMGGDLAKFSVHASGLTAAIQDSKLEFDANGLTIKNGGLYVYDSEGNKDLYFDNDKLVVKGRIEADSGSFEGHIEATSGSFKGKIEAIEGEIGGFKISEGKLISKKKSSENETPFLTLDGTNGKITAENIDLGIGATITDYIKLGESYLYNPDKYDGTVLKANRIELKNGGTLNLGTIRLYGGTGDLDGSIGSRFIDGNGNNLPGKWTIYENGHAEFEDITVDNVTLKNSVLEIGTIQSAGSLMVFKEAWKVNTAVSVGNTLKITLKDYKNALNIGDWVFTKDTFFQVKQISDDNETITLDNQEVGTLVEDDILMRMGQSGTREFKEFFGKNFASNEYYYEKNDNETYDLTEDTYPQSGKQYYYRAVVPKDYIISISGSRNNLEDYASPNSLTISDFYINDMNNKIWTKHLILGDLSSSGILDLKKEDFKFGLYSDNVYLNGSLITKNRDGVSAGISTTHEQYTNGERIVFWAGADTTNTNGIKEAPFRVTQDGSIYANKGTFKGSIITDSIIQGSDVYTMRLHGGTQGGLDALQIYGTTIGFYKEEGEPEKSIFTIGSNGFKKGENTFINLEGVPTFIGNLKSGKIAVVNDEINGDAINISKYKISLEYFEYNNEENERLTISQSGTNLIEIFSKNIRNKVSTYCDEDFWLGNKIHYQKVLNEDKIVGYDLYVD